MAKRKDINILLSSLSLETTCTDIELPLQLACNNCKKYLDPILFTRNRKEKTQKNIFSRNKCKQLWDQKWADARDSTYHQKHILSCRYLHIQVER